MSITFEPLKESHFPLMVRWLESAHVKKWWDQEIVYTLALVKEKFGQNCHQLPISNDLGEKAYAYIIKVQENPIGYIQVYNAIPYAATQGLDLRDFTGPIGGVDLFIGERDYLYKGLGPLILNTFTTQILTPLFNWCLIDPAAGNQSAIKAFEKAGFRGERKFQTEQTTWMIKKLSPIV